MSAKPQEPLCVTAAESGQKLLQYLQRRLDLPPSLLHRFIRSGQVRLNGKRVKAFALVQQGDMVRVPPYSSLSVNTTFADASGTKLPLPPLVFSDEELLVFNKPAGLPVQPGSGHSDSLTSRLQAHYCRADFMPTPAHRLDKATSGLILVAKSYRMLRLLHGLLADRADQTEKDEEGGLSKYYVAWVQGLCPWTSPRLLEDQLAKQPGAQGERMVCLPNPSPEPEGSGQYAALKAYCLRQQRGYSLLHIRLCTGRTHQIRAQLSSRGLPLIGDPKYGGPKHPQGMLLHAACLQLILPGYHKKFVSLPLWSAPWQVDDLPDWPESLSAPGKPPA